MNFGEQVLKERDRLKLTQSQLATKAKISLDTLCRIEQQRNSNPTLYVIQALSKALNNYKFNLWN